MSFATSGFRAMRRAVSEKLGVCPFCMRASARGALAAWSLCALTRGLERWAVVPALARDLLLAGASAFTFLIATHLVAYMVRHARKIRAIERRVAPRRPAGRVFARREFVSAVLGAGASAAAIAVFGRVPAFAGIVNCPAGLPMNREVTGVGPTQQSAREDFDAFVDAVCDLECSHQICAAGGCVRSSVTPRVTSEPKLTAVGSGWECTGTIKKCTCTCSTCAVPHSLNRWGEMDNAAGVDNTQARAQVEMMKKAREKCDKECARYRDCAGLLNCKRAGDPDMDPDTHKTYGNGGVVWVEQRVKSCHCGCQ